MAPSGKAELAAEVWQRLFDFITATSSHRNKVFERYELTPNDSRALFALDGEGRTMGTLAAEWSCDASYATSVIDRLEAKGLAARRDLPGDRRVKLAVLTALGSRIKQALRREIYHPPTELLALDTTDLKALWHAAEKLRPSAT